MPSPSEGQLLGVHGRTSTEAFAVGWDGLAIRFDGRAWSLETTTATVPLTDVAAAPEPSGPVFAVGWGGTVLIRDDGQWIPAPRTSSTTADLFGVHLVAADDGLAVGDRGTVLAWDGMAWRDVDFQVESELSGELVRPRTTLAGVWSADGRRWYLTGAGGASFRSQNRLARFEALDTRESVPLRGVWGTGGAVYAVGLEGIVLRFDNRWRRTENPLPDAFLFGIGGQSEADLTVVGWRGTIGRRVGGEWRLESAERQVDLRDLWVDPETGAAFAVGARGTILTRTSTSS